MPKSLLAPSMCFGALLLAILWAGFAHPGTFNVDELHYLLAAKQWAHHGTHTMPNGFGAFRTELLLFLHPHPSGGLPTQHELTSFVPPFTTFLSAPPYALFGRDGLAQLSSVAWLGSLLLVVMLAVRLAPRDSNESPLWHGALAGALFMGSSYFADYAIALTNHMPALFLLLAAVACHPVWWADWQRDAPPAPRVPRAVACGLLVGLACGVRLQAVAPAVVLALGCLALPRRAWATLAGFLAGFLPPLLAMAAINAERFGTFQPFTYGTPANSRLVSLLGPALEGGYGWLVLAGALLAGVLGVAALRRWVLAQPEPSLRVLLLVAAGGAALLMLLLLPRTLERIIGLVPAALASEPAQVAGGILWNGPRRALLQSFPLGAMLAVVPVLLLVPRPTSPAATAPLLLVLATAWANVALVLMLRNNGGFFMNQRYLIEAAALAIIVAPLVLVPMLRACPPMQHRTAGWALRAGASVAGVLAAFMLLQPSPALAAGLMLDRLLGLALAAALVAAVAMHHGARLVPLVWALLPCLLILPFMRHMMYEMRPVHAYRESRHQMHLAMAEVVPDGSLMVVYGGQREPAGRLKESRDVWVADAFRTDFEGVAELLENAHRMGLRQHLFITVRPTPRPLLERLNRTFRLVPVKFGSVDFLQLIPRDGPAPQAEGPEEETP